MAKDPAFLFYPNDFMGGTMGMTLEEKGGYMELLILQFNKGAFTMEQAKKLLNGAFERIWPVLCEKFVEAEGKFFNQRLEEEKQKRENFIAFAKESGSRGGKKKWENKRKDSDPISDPINHPNSQNLPCAIENENEDRNENEVIGEGVEGEKFLVREMRKEWKNVNKTYPEDDEHDLPALAKLAIFIGQQEQLKTVEVFWPENQSFILDKWQAWCVHIRGSTKYQNYSLQKINKFYRQEILQEIKNPSHGKNGKQQQGFVEKARNFLL